MGVKRLGKPTRLGKLAQAIVIFIQKVAMARKYAKNATTKNNVLKLVKALLALADGKIAVPEDKLKATFDVRWEKEDELLVSGKIQQKRHNRTQTVDKGITKDDLWALVECLGEALELPQPKDEKKVDRAQQKANAVQDVLDCLKYLDVLVPKPSVKTQGFWTFHLKLKHQTAKEKDNLKVIEDRWKIKIGSVTGETSHETSKNNSLNWQEICRQNLAEQKQLTTNLFTNAYGVTPQLDEIYVPLAIVERKPSKPPSRDRPEEKEEEKLIPIAEERFFEEVLRQGKSEISQGRKIAIIGEPGSGKTTRLQKIADWILEQELGLPIWVSLADLTQPTITQYIEDIWLKQTGQNLTIDALTQQKHLIWLLLDGLDERTSKVEMCHVSALLGGWVQAARVVVTCRVNVWEADKNAFSGFDVFRNLEFNPEQVTDYIRRWFAEMRDAATGESLEATLAKSENSRLKELIQNPLRLWMLCLIWQTGGGLPKTQAGLYAQFVDWVYRWKADEEILDQREAIDTALARLALAAMEQKDEVSRLRLRESWVVKVLGSRQIFEAVKKLGWLNRVERFPEAICVFYHATFQEYFAALAVEDWDDFLPRNHVNFPLAGKEYRIFEPQWKQVILLWIGRTNLENNKEKEKEKENFIHKLIDFKYGCSYYEHDFYKFRSQFLAAWLTQELENNDWQNYFINWLIKIGLGWWNSETNEWQYYLLDLNSSIARKILIQINTNFAREKMLEIIDKTDESLILSLAVWCLGEMYPSSDVVINKLLSLICKSSQSASEYKVNGVHYQAIKSLSKIAFKNQKAISFLKELIDSRIDFSTKFRAVKTLAKISPDFVNEASEILLAMLNDTSNDQLRCDLAIALGEISPIHQDFVVGLLAQIAIKHESITHRKVEKYLASIQKQSVFTANSGLMVNQEYDLIQDIIKWVNDIVTDFNEKRIIIELLSPLLEANKVDEGTDIYKLLLDIIKSSNSEELKYIIGYSLQETKKTQAQLLFIVEYLSKYLTLDFNIVHYQLLWNCAQNLPYPDFYRAWHGLTETQTSPLVQTLNLAQLPQLLQTQLTESNLHQTLQLLCIDSSKFDNRDNPAIDIYLQLIKKHHCPKSTEGTPRTLTELKIYWQLLDWDKHPILIFYEGPTSATAQGFSPTFLDALTRFDGTICLITDTPHPPLQTFSPHDPDLLQTVVNCLKRLHLES